MSSSREICGGKRGRHTKTLTLKEIVELLHAIDPNIFTIFTEKETVEAVICNSNECSKSLAHPDIILITSVDENGAVALGSISYQE